MVVQILGMILSLLLCGLGLSLPTSSQSSASVTFPESLTCGNRHSDYPDFFAERIVGGVESNPGEFPWQVSLQVIRYRSTEDDESLTVEEIQMDEKRRYHICGGAILDRFHVLTAAHCVYNSRSNVDSLAVLAGEHDIRRHEGSEQYSEIGKLFIHEDYDKRTFANDVALLRLKWPLDLDSIRVGPICLPESSPLSYANKSTASGWGALAENGRMPDTLHKVNLPLLTQEECRETYEDQYHMGGMIRDGMVCAGYKYGRMDSCQGDSGGPLICKQADESYSLCGLVSWGVGCARPNLPGVYTDVAFYHDWITEKLGSEY